VTDGPGSLLALFAFSFTLALSGALMPGPLLTVTLTHAGRRGFSAGPLVVLGHALAELAVVALVVAGLSRYLRLPAVEGSIAVAGGLLLILLGTGMVRSSPELPEEGSVAPATGPGPVLAGVVASVANPYWSLWWATVGLGYLSSAVKSGFLGLAVFFAGHISADLAWYSLIALGVARGRRFLGRTGYGRLVAGCGIFLLAFGVWFLFRGGRMLF
jgi:threonine/homoserine/homoserine lactone efflux protein